MNAYSEDLRKKKIVEAAERGTPKTEVTRAFGVGVSSVKRYVVAARDGRSLAPKKRPGSKPRRWTRPQGSSWRRTRKNVPRRLCPRKARVPRARGRDLGERLDGLADARTLGLQPKKRSVGATERELEFLRAAWRTLVAGETDAGRLVFVDEMGSNVSLSPLYASWSREGEQRAFGSVPRNWAKNVTLLSSMTREGMGPSCVAVEGATTGAVFEADLE